MILSQNTVRLYRAMDVKNSLTLTSKITSRLSTHSMNKEIVSHELCSKTKGASCTLSQQIWLLQRTMLSITIKAKYALLIFRYLNH